MATLQDLINAVDGLQDSVTNLTGEVNIRKASLDQTIVAASGSAQTALSSQQIALTAATGSLASQVAASGSAAAALASQTAASGSASSAAQSAVAASGSAAAALTSRNQAEGFRNDSQTILSDIQALLPNFPNAFIFALNKRAITDGATVTTKLRYMRDVMKNQLGFPN